MVKVSAESKKKYFEKIKIYREKIDSLLMIERKVLSMLKRDEADAPFKKLMLANEALNIVSYYLLMNELSLVLLGVRSETFLNAGRKMCSKALIYLEGVFTGLDDVPCSQYEGNLEAVATFSDEEGYNLICKAGFSIDAINSAFG